MAVAYAGCFKLLAPDIGRTVCIGCGVQGLICVVGLVKMRAGGSATSRESYPLPGNKNFYFHDVLNSLMYILVNGNDQNAQ